MESARTSLERIVNCASNLTFLLKTAEGACSLEEKDLLREARKFRASFEKAMDDDFNTADAISAIFELVKWINSNVSESSSADFLTELKGELVTLTDICGLSWIRRRPWRRTWQPTWKR